MSYKIAEKLVKYYFYEERDLTKIIKANIDVHDIVEMICEYHKRDIIHYNSDLYYFNIMDNIWYKDENYQCYYIEYLLGKIGEDIKELLNSQDKNTEIIRDLLYRLTYKRIIKDVRDRLKFSGKFDSHIDIFDQYPRHMIAFKNGLYDILADKIREITREDYVYMTTGYEWNDSIGDMNVARSYIQRVFPDANSKKIAIDYFAACLIGEAQPLGIYMGDEYNRWIIDATFGDYLGKMINEISIKNTRPINDDEIMRIAKWRIAWFLSAEIHLIKPERIRELTEIGVTPICSGDKMPGHIADAVKIDMKEYKDIDYYSFRKNIRLPLFKLFAEHARNMRNIPVARSALQDDMR